MASKPASPKSVHEYLWRLGNPYACTQVEGFVDNEPIPQPETTAAAANPDPLLATSARGCALSRPEQQDLFFAQPSNSAYASQPSGNPYAVLSQIDELEAGVAPSEKIVHAGDQIATQTEFVTTLRKVFSQYIPALERGRLRPEHRDFIERNRRRNGKVRYLLLRAILKYDLSDIVGLRPQFNREDHALTEKKLREIEEGIDEQE